MHEKTRNYNFGLQLDDIIAENPQLRNKLRNVVYYIHENCLILIDLMVQNFNSAKSIPLSHQQS